MHGTPTETDAADAVRRLLGHEPTRVERFPTGISHHVYDVTLAGGRKVVARLSLPGQRDRARGALGWHRSLRPRGVPLPELLAEAIEPGGGPFPVMILERLPGTDLQHVYPLLTREQRRVLAGQIVAIQRRMHELPPGEGYGFARWPGDADLHRRWGDVVATMLRGSRRRIEATGAVDPAHADRVERLLARHADALDAVPPTAFLDDTTTKNVIVSEGRLSGIVDVDVVCYGDPLLTVALTRMALLSRGHDTDYTDVWAGELALPPGRLALLDLYTAVFCVGFLSEIGQRFNLSAQQPVDAAHVDRLLAILDGLLETQGASA